MTADPGGRSAAGKAQTVILISLPRGRGIGPSSERREMGAGPTACKQAGALRSHLAAIRGRQWVPEGIRMIGTRPISQNLCVSDHFAPVGTICVAGAL